MLHLLRRHPIPIEAWFDYSLVLTYAVSPALAASLVVPPMEPEMLGGNAFVAAAMVRTRGLRPRGMPRFAGRDFFLSGYRVFTRMKTAAGRRLRGLRILRSDADSRTMVIAGNVLTHYNYHLSHVIESRSGGRIDVSVRSSDGEADCEVIASLSEGQPPLPEGSPFRSWSEARRFAGPLPFTFDYERETGMVVRIEGVRSNWTPRPVSVEVKTMTFFDRFGEHRPRLAAAFVVEDIPYLWKRGVVERAAS